jgi:CRISPR type IV-associated protein Csf3
MTHTSFVVIAALKTPVILSRDTYLTFDALLSGLIYRETENLDIAHTQIPLARTACIWHGSAAFLDSVVRKTIGPAFKAGLTPKEEMWAPAYQTGTGRNRDRVVVKRVDTARGPYQTRLDQYTGIAASTITWFAHGDLQRVRELLSYLRSVGAKARQGWGHVERIDIEELDDDLSMAYVTPQGATPMRPIPVQTWIEMGHKPDDCLVIDSVATPPYLEASRRERCVVPPARTAPWARQF